MRQLIIVRKDLNMSTGKIAAQCCHASLAFVSNGLSIASEETLLADSEDINLSFRTRYNIWQEWFQGIFTKTICEAKNRNQLMKAVAIAEELGLKENKDFFLIKDSCLTELTPEEYDEEGVGRTLTCIGFKPLEDEIAHKISKKFQLLK